MRKARQWFFSDFALQAATDIVKLYREGERASANIRAVRSYWIMAASFVLNGAVDEKIFLDANTEHIFVYAKIASFSAEMRELFKEPDYLIQLEKLVMKIPGIETKLENARRVIALWTKAKSEIVK